MCRSNFSWQQLTCGRILCYFVWLLLLRRSFIIKANHFNGGAITWKPVNNSAITAPIQIEIIQSYTWIKSQVDCPTIGLPISIGTKTGCCSYLNCTANCATSTSYTAPPITPSNCIGYSTSLDLSYSQRTDIVSFNADDYFTVAFVSPSGTYRLLMSNLSVKWTIASVIDIRRRMDTGKINTPPVALVFSPTSIPFGTTTQIHIPFLDVDGDDVICRWSAGVGECQDVCYPAEIPALTTVSTGCVISIAPLLVTDWYCAPLQIEDFYTTSTSSPLSSVPVQFLINVYTPPTYSIPAITGLLTDQSCVGVQAGVPWSTTLEIEQYGGSTVSISVVDIQQTFSPGVTEGPVTQVTTSLYTTSLSWTPLANQVGPQIICAVARDNASIPSNQYCLTFVVGLTGIGTCNLITTTTTLKPAVNRNIDLPLIIGISILALLPLLALCCFCCWWWWLCSPDARRRRKEEKLKRKYLLFNASPSIAIQNRAKVDSVRQSESSRSKQRRNHSNRSQIRKPNENDMAYNKQQTSRQTSASTELNLDVMKLTRTSSLGNSSVVRLKDNKIDNLSIDGKNEKIIPSVSDDATTSKMDLSRTTASSQRPVSVIKLPRAKSTTSRGRIIDAPKIQPKRRCTTSLSLDDVPSPSSSFRKLRPSTVVSVIKMKRLKSSTIAPNIAGHSILAVSSATSQARGPQKSTLTVNQLPHLRSSVRVHVPSAENGTGNATVVSESKM